MVAQSEKGKRLWMERLRPFSIREDGGLLWNNFKVPTMEQLTAVLNPVHLKDEKHTRDVQTLQKQLTDKGFVLPAFLGGIERAVKVLVLHRKSCCEKGIKGTLLGKEFLSFLFFYRYLHDCPQCFWKYQKGYRWQKAVSVAPEVRKETCLKFGLKFHQVKDEYRGLGVLSLGEPKEMSCKSILAEGGGKCWVSSVFYLLTGRKSG